MESVTSILYLVIILILAPIVSIQAQYLYGTAQSGGEGGGADAALRPSKFDVAENLMHCVGLASIDLGTGEATIIGITGLSCDPGNGFGFDETGQAWHINADLDNHLYRVNEQLGTSTLEVQLAFIGFPTFDMGFPRINAMDFDPLTGQGYVSVNAGEGGSTHLKRIFAVPRSTLSQWNVMILGIVVLIIDVAGIRQRKRIPSAWGFKL